MLTISTSRHVLPLSWTNFGIPVLAGPSSVAVNPTLFSERTVDFDNVENNTNSSTQPSELFSNNLKKAMAELEIMTPENFKTFYQVCSFWSRALEYLKNLHNLNLTSEQCSSLGTDPLSPVLRENSDSELRENSDSEWYLFVEKNPQSGEFSLKEIQKFIKEQKNVFAKSLLIDSSVLIEDINSPWSKFVDMIPSIISIIIGGLLLAFCTFIANLVATMISNPTVYVLANAYFYCLGICLRTTIILIPIILFISYIKGPFLDRKEKLSKGIERLKQQYGDMDVLEQSLKDVINLIEAKTKLSTTTP